MEYNETVALTFASSGSVYTDFATSIIDISLRRKNIVANIITENGPYITINRNMIVAKFLQTDIDWMFSFDTDIIISIKDFDIMIDAANKDTHPVLGGKYFLSIFDGYSNKIRVSGQLPNSDNNKLTDQGKWIEDYPEDSIIDGLWNMGMGYVLIHRSVLEKIVKDNPDDPYPWFKQEYRSDPYGWITEDVWFYEQVRNSGFNIAMHTGASSRHINKLEITEENFKNDKNI